jgi:D-serine deaminase-like pyridoxal phosphate-dependent protein
MASRVNLGLIVDSSEAIEVLAEQIDTKINVWIKVDTGYGRTGVRWDQTDNILRLAKRLNEIDHLNFKGLLTHNGHSYKVKSEKAIREVYKESTKRLHVVYDILISAGFENIELSTGDTPCCSVIDDFSDVDEIRPGNFVFYDLMQTEIGSCRDEQVAVVVACPVVGIYPDREEIVIYGGGVHFSKESIDINGSRLFGCLADMNGTSISAIRLDVPVVSLSQEHGTIHVPKDILKTLNIGDIVHVVPVHSCLTVNCLSK